MPAHSTLRSFARMLIRALRADGIMVGALSPSNPPAANQFYISLCTNFHETNNYSSYWTRHAGISLGAWTLCFWNCSNSNSNVTDYFRRPRPPTNPISIFRRTGPDFSFSCQIPYFNEVMQELRFASWLEPFANEQSQLEFPHEWLNRSRNRPRIEHNTSLQPMP